ncbi:NAD(P)-dependent dehydrogenase (short-subunit alcohol dehydrogenase family) [Paenibacillus jamilae]|jgi:NAD(P)-dependent dehydrogenase (short-subunit alcohol dehydrogenase family)|uniref:Oxidoreductase n=2 Tax=Paenibacillus polymyxa TaxID=1406 RepID=E3EE22_PAEPS|nr:MULTISPECIES: SDR family oxidoreductase [Paenibacillus]MCF2717080.1 SDR family oxidoreductase [Paenibacillus sp. UKAQ_18]ADO54502.1 oxidoreductase [Paenibacillus polymyxa SC2]KAE8558471.1 oxidoreductase [Paenibacillus polymyxa]KEO78122.1 oxidoreductase [Paenibacillus polymyxa]KJD37435.1 oxidoreductase [Paenibacillus polymyxa]
MGKFDGKVAVVTGGTSGIGLASAQQFVKEGAYVFITGRRQRELDEAVKQIGKNVTGVRGDISKSEDLDILFETVKREKGHLDILFANAGLGSFLPLGEITEAQYYKTFDVNVKGTIFTVQKALALFPNKRGSIILTGSTAGSTGMPAFSIYGASKAAIRQLVRSWILDMRGTEIRINILSPGTIVTPAYDELFGSELDHLLEQAKNDIPLGRVGQVEEISNAVMFLASNESSYMNGVELFVDGGVAQV